MSKITLRFLLSPAQIGDLGRFGYSPFFLASYDSTVLVWIMTDVSPFCQYSERLVTVRTTLQEFNPNEVAKAVNAAISTETMIFKIRFFITISFNLVNS